MTIGVVIEGVQRLFMTRSIRLNKADNLWRIEAVLKSLLIVSIIFVSIKLIFYHFQVISNIFPNEYRESATLLMTDLLLKGGHPYALENQPEYTNVYGIFYHILVLSLAQLFGTTLPVHRVVSALFIFSACSVFFAALRWRRVSLVFSLSATLILYAHLLYFTTPLARPDGLGFFLFLYSILIPWRFQYSSWSRLVSVIFGILGFLTKPYFVLSILYLTLYLFLFKSKKLGIQQGAISLVSLAITIWIVNQNLETYFNNVLWINYYIAGQDILYPLQQLYAYSKTNLGIILVFIICLLVNKRINIQNYQNDKNKINKSLSFNFRNLEKPLINFNIGFIEFSLILSLFIFLSKLGQHWGSWLIYIHHLISPFLILLSFELLDNQLKHSKNKFLGLIFSLLVLLNLLSVSSSQFLPPLDYNLMAWKNLKVLVSQHKNIFNSPAIASILLEQGKKVYDSGQSQYFVLSTKRPAFLDKIISPKRREIQRRYDTFLQKINNDVKSKKYDLVILTKGYSPFISEKFLKKYYSYQKTFVAPMSVKAQRNWELDIWKPKLS
jgi:hypothetical protein